MNNNQFRTLINDALVAADPRSGGLLDYRDLQQLLHRVAVEAESLLDERNELDERLSRRHVFTETHGAWRHPGQDHAPAASNGPH